jgi:hypothetical protein
MHNTRYSCPILMKHEFSPQIFEKYSDIKFYVNPSCGQKDGRTDEQIDVKKLIASFRNFAKAHKNNILFIT